MKRYAILLLFGVVTWVIGLGVYLGNMESKLNELQTDLAEQKQHMKAYQNKVDDLAVAYINHHGGFPRRK